MPANRMVPVRVRVVLDALQTLGGAVAPAPAPTRKRPLRR